MSHTPTVVHDFADPLPRTRWPAFSAEMVSLGLRSCFTTPIVSPHPDEKVLGTFAIYHREPGDPSPHDQQLVDFVTRTVALVIERSQAEERLRERDEQLRRIAAVLSDADRRKNEFLAMLADELRNPLAPIRNALQVMRLTGGNGEAVRSMTEMLERQVGQMVRLVDDLLDGSRISRGTIELRKGRIELASAVNHAVEANRPLCASMNHELTVTLPAPPVYLNADPTRLAQVVGSLLNNACRFTDTSAAAGRLLISGRALPTSSWHGRNKPHFASYFSRVPRPVSMARFVHNQEAVEGGVVMLVEFIELHRDEIIRRCRAKVAARADSAPTQSEVDHGVPMFLDQLGHALRLGGSSTSDMRLSALLHGRDLLQQDMTVSQVVHDYGDVCQSITALAVETGAPISTHEFGLLNGCLDDAIAGAVSQYGRDRAQSIREDLADRQNQRLGYFAHELRNFIQTALMAFDALQSGKVGPGGSTGAILRRSLTGARDLVGRSLAEVRLTEGIQNPESFLATDFMEELTASASLEAQVRCLGLRVPPCPEGVAIYADRQVILAVMTSVLQNAFKFTRPDSTVTLRVVDAGDRVRIEVEDECGGLPSSDTAGLFVPFEQRSGDRSGLGLGLAFSRWAVEANAGHIFARDLPGVGCVFTVDVPRGRLSAMTTGLVQ